MNIAIDLDQTITASRQSIEFFEVLTHLLCPSHKIIILTNRYPGTEQMVADELHYLGIDYSDIVITSEKAQYIRENNISVYFENEDEYFLELGEEVTVFKIREVENFNFTAKKWYGSKETTEMTDE